MSDTRPPTSSQSADGVIKTETSGRLFLIGIDRPKKYNAFTKKMLTELAEAFTAFEENNDLWCALLYAEGEHFTAGLQLDTFNITDDLCPAPLVDPFGLRKPVRSKPLVAAVQGICFTAGVELVLASDIIVAADDCRFAQLEVKRGLMAFGGASIRMVERAGWGNAMRYLLTGDEFSAAEAYRLGFVQEVVPAGEQLARATELADRIATQAPLAVRETRASSLTYCEHGIEAAVKAFPEQLRNIFSSEDFAEGVRSFLERREANFKGR